MSTPALKIYNTLTRTKEEFRPIDPAHVRMYVCGPTVYDYAHIGNARPLIVFDVLFRLLRHLYGAEHVAYVRNITDVDDKINARAFERGISIRELTDKTIDIFHEDVRALGCLNPTIEPRATDYIQNDDKQIDMVRLIQRLLDSGHAYVEDRHVLFDVTSMPTYGRLSRRPLDEMIAGARVDVAPYKRGDMDFVLWKPSKDDEPGWQSPWGRGRPGWHIECSAMSAAHLGETFDIHGGGIDLVFPHHENEIAQSCCAFGRDVMANYWMHNGFLQVEGEKMSKSLGNFVTIHELLHTEKFGGRKWPGEVLRLAMLRTHYRQPIDWTVKALEEAELSLRKWAAEIGAVELDGDGFGSGFGAPDGTGYGGGFAGVDTILSALADDLNTPFALTILHAIENKRELDVSLNLLGIDVRSYANWVQIEKSRSFDEDAVFMLISARNAARASKNWAESDRIRDELAAVGIALKDNKDGTTTWEVKR
ncbi:MAG: cysteine--tRNA ligase [Methylocystis sp.]|nr:cysteine--tRNA ligase [Methylocystis sp.]